MEPLYGIVKDYETASKFVSDLLVSMGPNAELVGGTTVVESLQAAAGLNVALRTLGFSDTMASEAAKMIILTDAIRIPYGMDTKNADGEYIDQAITFGDTLALIVRARITDTTDPAYSDETKKSNVIIRKKGKDGRTVDTYLLDNSVYSTYVSNDCFAYCIQPTTYGDTIVKLSGCNENAVDLPLAFTALSIGSYTVYDGGVIQSERSHNSDFFLTQGPYGGFLISAMKKSGLCGITVFDRRRTPLFIWTDDSHAPAEIVDGVVKTFANTTGFDNTSLGRLTGEYQDYGMTGPEPFSDDDLTYFMDGIQQAVLAPVFCKSVGNDITKTSKWLYQAPHNYGPFDASQFIRVGGEKGAVYLCDQGICALEDGANYSFGDRSVPDIQNMSVQEYERPRPPVMMPYHDGFDIYFDSLVDYPEGIKYNLVDETNDMITNGTVNPDGSLALHLGATGSTFAYCGTPAFSARTYDGNDRRRQMYAVFRIKNGAQNWTSSEWALLFGNQRNPDPQDRYNFGQSKYFGFGLYAYGDTRYVTLLNVRWSYDDKYFGRSGFSKNAGDVIVCCAISDNYSNGGAVYTAISGGNHYGPSYPTGWRTNTVVYSDILWSEKYGIGGGVTDDTVAPSYSITSNQGQYIPRDLPSGQSLDIDLLFLASGPPNPEGTEQAGHIYDNVRFLKQRFNLDIPI